MDWLEQHLERSETLGVIMLKEAHACLLNIKNIYTNDLIIAENSASSHLFILDSCLEKLEMKISSESQPLLWDLEYTKREE